MKTPTFGALGFAGVAFAALVLTIIGAPGGHQPPAPIVNSAPARASVAENGFTLTSAEIELPDDSGDYPAGPHADTVNANCTACHSASMALTQPPLSAGQWKAEVTKMREVYRAPVAAADVPAIIDYLVHLPAQQTGPRTGRAQDTDPKVAPDVSGATG